MKKILSIVIAMSVLLSMVCCIPASADGVMTLDDYTMDFEEKGLGPERMSSIQRTHSTVGLGVNTTENDGGRVGVEMTRLIDDPKDSSNTVMKLWLGSTTPGWDSTVRFSNTTVRGQANTPTASGTIPAGGKITYTFRYYLPQEVESNSPEFCVVHTTASSPVTATIVKALKTESGVWHTATLRYTNTGSTPIAVGNATLRTCGSYVNETTTNWTVKGHTGEGYGDREIYFDDFRIVTEAAPLPDTVASLADYRMGFEGRTGVGDQRMSSIQRTVTSAGEFNAPATNTTEGYHGRTGIEMTGLIADPEDSENTVMKLWLASSTDGWQSTVRFSSVNARGGNHPTASGTIPAGGKITYTFRYYFPQEMETSKSGNKPEFSVYHETGAVFALTESPLATESGVWHTATLSYVNEGSTPLEVGSATLRTSGETSGQTVTGWALKGHTGWSSNVSDYGDREIYFDDFRIVIEDAPEVPVIEGISIEKVEGGIKVSTDTELTAAKLIFVTYDGNGKMLSFNYNQTVALAAQGTQVYEIPDNFASAKVMLWLDMSATCKPLTDVLDLSIN